MCTVAGIYPGDRILGMIVAFAVAVISVALLLTAWFLRARTVLRVAVAVVLAISGLALWAAPAVVAATTGSTLFVQSFANNTVNATYPVSVPAPQSGTNYACLTASGNSNSGSLLS